MLVQSNLPPEWSSCTIGRVTSNVNHFSFQKIHMILMPFQTCLLDLKFENDRVTCFGNRIVMTCCSFQPGSGQYMPNASKYTNHLFSQISTGWMHLEINAALHCLLSFPECHFHTAVSWSFLCLSSLQLPSWHHPHQTDETPSLGPFWTDVVIMQKQVCQGGVLFEAFSQSLAVDTWLEKNGEGHSTHLSQSCEKSHSHSSSHL